MEYELNEPSKNSYGYYISVKRNNKYLTKNGTIEEFNSNIRNQFYFDTLEEALEAKANYEQNDQIGIVHKLSEPQKDGDLWSIRSLTNPNFCLSEDLKIIHSAYRMRWKSETGALFAKLRYERNTR